MYLGRVVGCLWSTVKAKDLEGQRLLIVQPLTPELTNTGKRLICTDSTGAGAGELIYWVRGKESSFPFLPNEVPVDTTIVGIVDEIHVDRSRRNEIAAAAPAAAANEAPPPKPSRKGKR
jgi:ethanolamine utilization protein EutN